MNPTQKEVDLLFRLNHLLKAEVLVVTQTCYRTGLVATKKLRRRTLLSRKKKTPYSISHICVSIPKLPTKRCTESQCLSRALDPFFRYLSRFGKIRIRLSPSQVFFPKS